MTQYANKANDNLYGEQKLAYEQQQSVTDLKQLNGLNNPIRQVLERQINNA
ncbi:hypothetical protein, partial [Staphylococcus aureus]